MQMALGLRRDRPLHFIAIALLAKD